MSLTIYDSFLKLIEYDKIIFSFFNNNLKFSYMNKYRLALHYSSKSAYAIVLCQLELSFTQSAFSTRYYFYYCNDICIKITIDHNGVVLYITNQLSILLNKKHKNEC